MKTVESGGEASGAVPGSVPETMRPASPCHTACPVGINVKAYVGLIAAGRPEAAAAVIRERNPIPSACGRICAAPCERECRRGQDGGEPVAVRALKRFAIDTALERAARACREPERIGRRPERVAVVGGGPAGLTAAHDLARAGFGVTLFEAEARLGGLLAFGVPAFRLPPRALQADIELILQLGIEVRLGQRVDLAAPEALRAQGYAAVVVAVGGAWAEPARIGELAAPDLEDAGGLLRRAALGERPALPKRVLVAAPAGGAVLGAAAARLARRLGAEEVVLVSPTSMPGLALDDEERAGLERDGVVLRTGQRIVRAAREGTEIVLEVRNGSGLPARLATDRVWSVPLRTGAVPGGGLRRGPLGTIAVDPVTLETSTPRVFAAGEASAGPRGVVEAMASGRRAARSVRRLIAGVALAAPIEPGAPWAEEFGEAMPFRGGGRWRAPWAPLRASLDAPDPGLTEPAAMLEARRCLMCGPCEECRTCTPTCDFVLVEAAGRVVRVARSRSAAAGRPLAAVVDDDRCLGCGACAEACPWSIPRLGPARSGAAAASVSPEHCRSCGICAGVCPAGALGQAAPLDGAGKEARP